MKRGVVIANTGSPKSPDPADVAVYLEEFLGNPRIVPMNPVVWKRVLRHQILPKRSVKSGEKYRTIWTDSGFAFITNHIELAGKLEQAYREDGQDVTVRAAMSFGVLPVASVLDELVQAGCDRIEVLPLYPQNAFSQAYIVADQVYDAIHKKRWDGELVVIGDYSANLRYLHAIADAIESSGFDPSAGDRLIMGFHSIPRIDVANGDTYEQTTRFTCEWLADELGIPDGSWIRAFQCRFDKDRKWLEPYAHDILDKWWEEGFAGRIFYICPNFSVDCLETYYDVEGVLKTVWLSRKIEAGQQVCEDSFVYIPCLNATDTHVEVIRSVLADPDNYII